MHFFKYHALGNDYIIVTQYMENKGDYVSWLCNRHFGVGADGLICFYKRDNYFMDIYNADGSRALMCGNGIRCLARFLYENEYVKEKHFIIDTLSGPKKVWINSENMYIKVDMGTPMFDVDKIPVAFYETNVFLKPVIIGGVTYKISCVSMGNPHTCIFVENIDDEVFDRVCSYFNHNSLFPEGTNVELIKVIDRKNIEMRVWERGVGETYACGSGACASQVISVLCGYTNEEVKVHMKYGALAVKWDRESNKVFLSGEACFVYKGFLSSYKM